MASPPNYNAPLTQEYLSKTLGNNTIPTGYPSLGSNTVPLPTNYPIRGYVPPRPPTTITNPTTFDNGNIVLTITNPPLDASGYIPVIRFSGNEVSGVTVTGNIASGTITLRLPANRTTGDYTPAIKKDTTYISGSVARYTRPEPTITNPPNFTDESIELTINNPPIDASGYTAVIKQGGTDITDVTIVTGNIASRSITLRLPSNRATGNYTPAIKKGTTYISGSVATYTRRESTIAYSGGFDSDGSIEVTITDPPLLGGTPPTYKAVIKDSSGNDISGGTVSPDIFTADTKNNTRKINFILPFTAATGNYKPAIKKTNGAINTYISIATNAAYERPKPVRFYTTNLSVTDGSGNLSDSLDFPNFTDNQSYQVFLDNYYMEIPSYYINQNRNYSNEYSTSRGFLFILDNLKIPYYITNHIEAGKTFIICKRTDNMGESSKPLSYYGVNLDTTKRADLILNASDVTSLTAFTQTAINGLKFTCLRNYRFYTTDWNAVTRGPALPADYTISGTDALDISGGFDIASTGIYNINFDNFAELDNPSLATIDPTPDSSFYTEPTAITNENYTKFFVWDNSPTSFYPYYLQKDLTGYYITKTLRKSAPANYPGNKDINKKIYFHIYKDGEAITLDKSNLINPFTTTKKITFTHMRPSIGLNSITSYNDPTPRSSPYIPPFHLYALDLYVQTLPTSLANPDNTAKVGSIVYYIRFQIYKQPPASDMVHNKTGVDDYPMTPFYNKRTLVNIGDKIGNGETRPYGPQLADEQLVKDQIKYLNNKEKSDYLTDRVILNDPASDLNKGTKIAIANFVQSQVYYLNNTNSLAANTVIRTTDFASKLFVKHKTENLYYKITPISPTNRLTGLKNTYDFIWKISDASGNQVIHCALYNDPNTTTKLIKVNADDIKTLATKLPFLVMPTAGGGSNNKTRKNKTKRI